MRLKALVLAVAVTLVALGFLSGFAAGNDRGTEGSTDLPGFSRVVSLSHTNAPAKSPLFPG